MVAKVWTGVGFSNSKNFTVRIWIHKRNRSGIGVGKCYRSRSGIGVGKCDSGHICWLLDCWLRSRLAVCIF